MATATWDVDDNKHENHWRRTFCQIPFPAIYQHAEDGKQSLHRLVTFFRRKAHAERSMTEQLQNVLHTPMDTNISIHLEDLEEPGSSIRKALAEVQHFVDATSHQQLLLAKVLEEQVAEPLVSLQEVSETYIRTLEDEIRNVNDAYNNALSAHNIASTRLRKATEELYEAKERQHIALHGIGVPEFELQRLAARVQKCQDERAHAELLKSQAKTGLYNRIVARDEMAMAVSVAYQRAEEERLDQLYSCLNRFLHIEQERVKAAEKMVQALESKIHGIQRAEDIQLLVHNHRNVDNMHFQGKALALLDWHWAKMTSEKERKQEKQHFKASRALETDSQGDPIVIIPPLSVSTSSGSASLSLGKSSRKESPHGSLDTTMSRALQLQFASDSLPNTPCIKPNGTPSVEQDENTKNGTGDEGNLLSNISTDAASLTVEVESTSLLRIVQSTCESGRGRALFNKCMNRQRSIETRIRDLPSFDLLVECFNVFLDLCIREDDVKAAKTAMILAETFYVAREEKTSTIESTETKLAKLNTEGSQDDINSLTIDPHETRPRANSRHIVGRGSARMYLQEQVKQHAIWKNFNFWEKALLLAIGEELQRTPQLCSWEDLPTSGSKQNTTFSETLNVVAQQQDRDSRLPTREEAVSRVHNIVFGQLGSFTLSMMEFEVPFVQIESFIETMCDAHELTEDQRFLLRKNLQESFCVLNSNNL